MKSKPKAPPAAEIAWTVKCPRCGTVLRVSADLAPRLLEAAQGDIERALKKVMRLVGGPKADLSPTAMSSFSPEKRRFARLAIALQGVRDAAGEV